MRIINLTKNTILAEKIIVAEGVLQRMVGLLNRKELRPNEALILKPCDSMHTFFMRFPIDVLFVNKENKVVKAIAWLKPFRLSGIYFNAHFAIELPCGTIQSSKTQTGDILGTPC